MVSPAPQMQSPTEMQPEMQPEMQFPVEMQSPTEMQSPAASPPGGDCASPESAHGDASARYHPLVHLQYEIALDRREAGELSSAISFFVQ